MISVIQTYAVKIHSILVGMLALQFVRCAPFTFLLGTPTSTTTSMSCMGWRSCLHNVRFNCTKHEVLWHLENIGVRGIVVAINNPHIYRTLASSLRQLFVVCSVIVFVTQQSMVYDIGQCNVRIGRVADQTSCIAYIQFMSEDIPAPYHHHTTTTPPPYHHHQQQHHHTPPTQTPTPPQYYHHTATILPPYHNHATNTTRTTCWQHSML
jgi:hypothetical protein